MSSKLSRSRLPHLGPGSPRYSSLRREPPLTSPPTRQELDQAVADLIELLVQQTTDVLFWQCLGLACHEPWTPTTFHLLCWQEREYPREYFEGAAHYACLTATTWTHRFPSGNATTLHNPPGSDFQFRPCIGWELYSTAIPADNSWQDYVCEQEPNEEPTCSLCGGTLIQGYCYTCDAPDAGIPDYGGEAADITAEPYADRYFANQSEE